jgi:hypothetical protein
MRKIMRLNLPRFFGQIQPINTTRSYYQIKQFRVRHLQGCSSVHHFPAMAFQRNHSRIENPRANSPDLTGAILPCPITSRRLEDEDTSETILRTMRKPLLRISRLGPSPNLMVLMIISFAPQGTAFEIRLWNSRGRCKNSRSPRLGG